VDYFGQKLGLQGNFEAVVGYETVALRASIVHGDLVAVLLLHHRVQPVLESLFDFVDGLVLEFLGFSQETLHFCDAVGTRGRVVDVAVEFVQPLPRRLFGGLPLDLHRAHHVFDVFDDFLLLQKLGRFFNRRQLLLELAAFEISVAFNPLIPTPEVVIIPVFVSMFRALL